jgi:hypothetical protein
VYNYKQGEENKHLILLRKAARVHSRPSNAILFALNSLSSLENQLKEAAATEVFGCDESRDVAVPALDWGRKFGTLRQRLSSVTSIDVQDT